MSLSPRLARQTLDQALIEMRSPERNPYLWGIRYLANLSREHGLDNDAFYFMAAKPSLMDTGYDPASPRVKTVVQELREQGFAIGLHAGYYTLRDFERMADEKAKLDAVLGETAYGGRQHYLRFQVPDTWRNWERLGLTFDATMGYADHVGFRCGTCHPFCPFDVVQNRQLDLWEEPLIVMDGTLREYQGLSPEQSEACILKLARRCRKVEGAFTLLWHNSSLHGNWLSWKPMYARAVRALAEMQA
jgi:hypothetical protein